MVITIQTQTNQPINQQAKQSTANQPTKQLANQPTNKPDKQSSHMLERFRYFSVLGGCQIKHII